jgi:hypothetical protein
MPFSATRVPGGIIFADYRSKGIYYYSIGSRPRKLSVGIEDQLFSGIADPTQAEGDYNPTEQEYHLGYSTDTSNPKVLDTYVVVDLKSGAISIDSGPKATTISVAVDVGDRTTIGGLAGSTIGSLAGTTIGELTGLIIDSPILLKGTSTGEVLLQDDTSTNDYDGTAFEFIWASQDIGSVARRRTIQEIQAIISADADADTVLEYSTDGTNWTTAKTITDPSTRTKIGFKKSFTGDHLYWRVRSKAKNFSMYEWWVRILQKQEKAQVAV